VTATSITVPVLAVLAVVLMNEVHPAIAAAVVPVTILVVTIPLSWLSSRIFAAGPTDYLQSHIRCDPSEYGGEQSSSQSL
jgi:peptidoglycan/LPS O-acetylase OafA/YrhL